MPIIAYSEQYDFSQFGKRKPAAPLSQLAKVPTGLSVELFGMVSPERFLLQWAGSQDAQDEKPRNSKKLLKSSLKRKHNEKSKQADNGETPSFNTLMRTQKGLTGFNARYNLSSKNTVVFTLPVFPLSPFAPLLGYQRAFPQVGKFSFYGRVGLLLPIPYFDEKPSYIDKAPTKTDKSSQSKGVMGDIFKRKKPTNNGADTSKSSNAATQNNTQSDQPTSQWRWDVGGFIKAGVRYPLYPNITFEASGNLIYPFTGETPPSTVLPFGLIASINFGIHYQLV